MPKHVEDELRATIVLVPGMTPAQRERFITLVADRPELWDLSLDWDEYAEVIWEAIRK